jgi:Cd2+/Zn2+-exporting ATPase
MSSQKVPETHSSCASSACCDAPSPVALATPSPAVASSVSTVWRIATMDCASEEGEIRRALEPIAGIRSLSFQLGARTLAIDAEAAALQPALDAIRKAGFSPKPVTGTAGGADATSTSSEQSHDGQDHHDHDHGSESPQGWSDVTRYVAALAFAVAAEALSYFAPDAMPWKIAGMALAAIAIGLAGLSTYSKGFGALRHGRLNINALMTVAVTGAFLIGQWPEAAMVMALYAIAELIEARSVDRARNAIKSLMALAPEESDVRQADGSYSRVLSSIVPLAAVVRVKPGERIPLDGVIVSGSSAINQAPVTGESMPVDKQPGDAVFAGTINETATLEIKITAVASNSTLARIIHAVEQAQGTRAPTQRFVDRFAAIYTPAVFALALAVALLSPWLLGWTWTLSAYKALVLLVIACPCALVISTPVTVVSALAAAARRGILIKGGTYLEEARNIKAIALDKTGTITEGKPKLVAFEMLADSHSREATSTLAYSLAAQSDHPVSKAVAAGLAATPKTVEAFTAIAGRGVSGIIDGTQHWFGNHRLIEERGLCSPAIEAKLQEHENQGRTVTLLATDKAVIALFAVADTIKASSQQAVAELIALGITPVMLTGDNSATASTVARLAGITDARGNLLPEDKLSAIEDMQRQYGPTAMSGDGINDAPALAKADIGFAMGGAGTDTAMEAADIAVMNDDLRRIPETIRLSKRTHNILWQNITLALGIKVVFMGLALFGNATMWMAVFADMGASLLVVFNGLRLLRSSEPSNPPLH